MGLLAEEKECQDDDDNGEGKVSNNRSCYEEWWRIVIIGKRVEITAMLSVGVIDHRETSGRRRDLMMCSNRSTNSTVGFVFIM